MCFHVAKETPVEPAWSAHYRQSRSSWLTLILGELAHIVSLAVSFHKPVKALACDEAEPLPSPGLPKQSFLDPPANGLRCRVANGGNRRNLDPLGG